MRINNSLLDEFCEEYCRLRELTKKKDTLSKAIKGLFGRKTTYNTEKYSIKITEQVKKPTVDLEKLKELYPEVYKNVVTETDEMCLVLKNVHKIENNVKEDVREVSDIFGELE